MSIKAISNIERGVTQWPVKIADICNVLDIQPPPAPMVALRRRPELLGRLLGAVSLLQDWQVESLILAVGKMDHHKPS